MHPLLQILDLLVYLHISAHSTYELVFSKDKIIFESYYICIEQFRKILVLMTLYTELPVTSLVLINYSEYNQSFNHTLTMLVSTAATFTLNRSIRFSPSGYVGSQKHKSIDQHSHIKFEISDKKNNQTFGQRLPAKILAFLWSSSSLATFSWRATNAAAQSTPICLIPPPNVFLNHLACITTSNYLNLNNIYIFLKHSYLPQ